MNKLICNIRIRILLAVIVSTTFLACSKVTNAQSEKALSTDYVLKDSFFFVSVRPSKLVELADKESETTTYVLEKMVEYTGLDLNKMDQILIQMGAGDDDNEVDDPGDGACIVFQFSDEIDMDEVEDKIFANMDLEEETIDDKPYYKPTNESTPGFYFPTKKTMIIAEDSRMQMMENLSGMNKGVELAGKLNADDHMGIVFDIGKDDENRRDMLNQILQDMDLSMMGIDDEMVEKVQSGEVRVDLESDTPIRATLVTSQDGTDDLVEAGEEAIESAREQLETMEEELANAPPEIAETAEKVIELMTEMLDNAKLTADGKKVMLVIEKKGGMADTVNMVAQAVEQVFQMIEQFGGGF